ncbi:nitroreductase/quinone reductase family protein [Nocardia huaxiensis]|uniref:Nitroreductase family deazaflavin-dependent oxidoreductase n=1 Tax=Nocardia huaxiensis TaxID=2755382 RepID=A0A7D6VKA7_9NOCA|nr:nitroreductase/quinone reductase family protein [Nocardia huaxiensis]QLY31510.1 nitroreductase family deazaflavin-dependent oxidoreductase [Nocardia huaxiensis]UFS95063.1 nitroreductase family deazaflavin-dependent oxidoreductase [Nocardia huaxiensis]
MSDSESVVPQSDNVKITSYDDPDAPWNQEFDQAQMGDWNAGVIQEFRENGGKVGGAYQDATILLLTTTGAKSGKQHVVPLGALYRDETIYVSSFIEDKYPAWWFNIKANPQVTVEIGGKTHRAVGRALEGADYDEFAAWVLANNPLLADFQSKIERPLPLVTLELGEEI